MNRAVTVVEPGTVKLERLLPGPVERVWAYLTEPEKRAKWLCGGEFDLRVGGKVQLLFDNKQLAGHESPPEKYRHHEKPHRFEGEITRLEPLRVLAYTWKWDDNDTEVTYELQPRGKDVLLTIVHRRVKGRDVIASVMGGWDVHSGILEDLLKGIEVRPFWSTHSKLEKEYAATL